MGNSLTLLSENSKHSAKCTERERRRGGMAERVCGCGNALIWICTCFTRAIILCSCTWYGMPLQRQERTCRTCTQIFIVLTVAYCHIGETASFHVCLDDTQMVKKKKKKKKGKKKECFLLGWNKKMLQSLWNIELYATKLCVIVYYQERKEYANSFICSVQGQGHSEGFKSLNHGCSISFKLLNFLKLNLIHLCIIVTKKLIYYLYNPAPPLPPPPPLHL